MDQGIMVMKPSAQFVVVGLKQRRMVRLVATIFSFNLLVLLPHETTSFSFSSSSSSSSRQPPKLIPEENPDIDPSLETSASGISYSKVLEGLHELYPPSGLEERNAASRTDGYWPYIRQGQDPPKQYTYGEFDFLFFAQLLDRVVVTSTTNKEEEKSLTFCDIGSGTGRLVMGAAALHPHWKLCRGIEILQSISDVAQTKLDSCLLETNVDDATKDEEEEEEWVENESGLLLKKDTTTTTSQQQPTQTIDENEDGDKESIIDDTIINDTNPPPPIYNLPVPRMEEGEDDDDDDDEQQRLSLAPVEFVCGSFEDPYLYFGDVDIVFCFSSCMSTSILQSLSQAIGRQCKPGTIVITTDFSLELGGYIDPHPDDPTLPFGEYELELIENANGIDGYCWLTGGKSTAYIHRVTKSLWDGTGPRIKPELSPSEKAYRAIKAMEEGKDDSAIRFLSGVRNDMFFAGFPERWLPDPNNYKPETTAVVIEEEED